MRLHGRTVLLLLFCAACGAHSPVDNAPDKSRPHMTWEIRTGGEFGEGSSVCGSARPAALCTLPATRPERPALVSLHLYLQAAGRQTNYVGVWRAPLLQGWTTADFRDVSGSVKPGEAPYHVSVSGIVTDKPGKYPFSVALDAAQEGIPDGTRITVDVPVMVTGSSIPSRGGTVGSSETGQSSKVRVRRIWGPVRSAAR